MLEIGLKRSHLVVLLTRKTWCTEDQENGNGILPPAVHVADDIDIGAIIANAKSSLDQEEREIEHLMTGIIDNEVWVFFFLYIDKKALVRGVVFL